MLLRQLVVRVVWANATIAWPGCTVFSATNPMARWRSIAGLTGSSAATKTAIKDGLRTAHILLLYPGQLQSSISKLRYCK